MGSAAIQGPLWGAQSRDWAEVQEQVMRRDRGHDPQPGDEAAEQDAAPAGPAQGRLGARAGGRSEMEQPAMALEGTAPDAPREGVEAAGAEDGGELLDDEDQPEGVRPLPDADPRQQHQQVAGRRARDAELLDEDHPADREHGVARQQLPHPPASAAPTSSMWSSFAAPRMATLDAGDDCRTGADIMGVDARRSSPVASCRCTRPPCTSTLEDTVCIAHPGLNAAMNAARPSGGYLCTHIRRHAT